MTGTNRVASMSALCSPRAGWAMQVREAQVRPGSGSFRDRSKNIFLVAASRPASILLSGFFGNCFSGLDCLLVLFAFVVCNV